MGPQVRWGGETGKNGNLAHSSAFSMQMENKLREIRGVGKPAGGLQLIMCGDFFQ